MSWLESYRVVVFVPALAAENFIHSISDSIPSFLGPYDKVCWWSAPGTEQYRPLEGADPAQGTSGETVRGPSVRVEFSLPRDPALLGHVVEEAILPAHPWDEPVILVQEVMIRGPR